MFNPDAKTCPVCLRQLTDRGKRCWYCERDWELSKADHDADQYEERARRRMAKHRTLTTE